MNEKKCHRCYGCTERANYFLCAECPASFTYIASVNGCYKEVTRNNCRLNWTDAGQYCRSLRRDAHLLVINDAQEQSTVASMLGQCIIRGVVSHNGGPITAVYRLSLQRGPELHRNRDVLPFSARKQPSLKSHHRRILNEGAEGVSPTVYLLARKGVWVLERRQCFLPKNV